MDPRWIQENFVWLQFAMVAALAGLGWILFRPRTPDSGFRLREADRPRPGAGGGPSPAGGPDLGASKMKRAAPLSLPGIRIDGLPHEILGVRPQASPQEIQRAYRELMKRYHPDKVGAPGTREWQDAQAIAEAINRAKDEMLGRRRG